MADSRSPAVEIAGLTRRFGAVTALDAVDLTVARGEFFSLLGPSGCGKTTLLRVIAGLESPDEGRVQIAGQDVSNVPAHRRPVNTVFQSYALFPHLNVWDNVAFGLRMKRIPSAEIKQRVLQAMELVQVDGLMGRKPSQLSGGQKQRVALARAIVNEPDVLLLDEPLGALDLQLRKQLQVELRRLQRRLGMTFLYVTHDQEEALTLSDRIAVIRHGRIEQLGEVEALYEHPRTRFVSQFLGSCNLLDGRVAERTSVGGAVETAFGRVVVETPLPNRSMVTLAIRPEKVQIKTERRLDSKGQAEACAPSTNLFPARVEQVLYVGAETHYELRVGTVALRAEVMNVHFAVKHLTIGQDVAAHLPPEALIILDD